MGSEQYRLECEAREWLKRGYNNRNEIRVLQNAITKRRGYAAAERLIEEMRKQWQIMQMQQQSCKK